MKEMHSFLSKGFACLAVALVILSVLAMPAQSVRADNPPPPPTPTQAVCSISGPPEFCPGADCVYGDGSSAGFGCDFACLCGSSTP